MNSLNIHNLAAEWKPVSEIFAAFGDLTRQKILLLFEPEEELSIKQIADALDLARSTAVHHIGVLEKAGLLAVRKQGKESLYRARPEQALWAVDALRDFILGNLINEDR